MFNMYICCTNKVNFLLRLIKAANVKGIGFAVSVYKAAMLNIIQTDE